ncbi:MAG: NUDIX hydrolase [Alphaproteobacteria bacterium]|nr:NUDIX hydrolase [Alphaproteobacteria bacterium]
MKVREDRIIRPNGKEGLFGIVEKNDYTVIAAIENNEMYLVNQYRYPVDNSYWELPQGASFDKNLLPVQVAAQELREETGLIAKTYTHIGKFFPAYGYSTTAFDFFIAQNLTFIGQQLEEEEEGLTSKSFPISKIEEMIINNEIKDSSTVACFGIMKLKKII